MPFAVNDNIKTPAVTGIDLASILAVCFVIYASTHVGGGGVEPPGRFPVASDSGLHGVSPMSSQVPHAVLTDGGGDEENATELQPLHLLAVAFSLLQWLPTVWLNSRCMS